MTLHGCLAAWKKKKILHLDRMLDANTEILNQDIVCLVSEVGPILYMFLEVTK